MNPISADVLLRLFPNAKMSTFLNFFVAGTPAPGGSKSAFALRRKDGSLMTRPGGAPVINMTDAGGKRNKDWRKIVGWTARAAMEGKQPTDAAVGVDMTFLLRRPKAHFGTGKNAEALKETAPASHLQKPDVLKLARSTEDALTGIVWQDDCCNVVLNLKKRWALRSEPEGCRIRVYFDSELPPVNPTLI